MNASKMVSVMRMEEDHDLMIITVDDEIIRIESGDIRQAGRNSRGVRLAKMAEGGCMAAARVVPGSDEVVGEDEVALPLQ